MFRDPLYRQIRRGLRELKDGNTFELCANDLLHHIYPWLAPREGGDDAGLDAAELSGKEPTKVADLLTTIEEQARAASISDLSWGRHVCWRIAETTDMIARYQRPSKR